MAKLKIIDKKSEKSINSERKLLTVLNHPFIVNMHYAFQDNDNLYLVLDFLAGGDLRYHVSRYRRFSEEQTRFFIASIVYALDYIHKNNVIHRDIKPENMVLDEKGYVRITDFGIAKENCEDNSNETSGTPGYMAPEVMRGKNHSYAVDFFAIGIIGYEFMKGRRPYYGQSKKEIKDQMLSTQAMIEPESKQFGWSPESVDFINQLLLRKTGKRLGSVKGTKDLMEHPWLKYYPWKEFGKKALLSPFIPEQKDNFDKKYCESIEKITEETKNRYADIIKKNKLNKKSFVDYYYNEEDKRADAKRIKIYRQLSSTSIDLSDNQQQSNNNNNICQRELQPNLLQTFLPISINKSSSSTLIILNKSLNNSRNIYENISNSNSNKNSSNIPFFNQVPLTNKESRLNNTNKANANKELSSRIPSHSSVTNDLHDDSIFQRDLNTINLIQKRLSKCNNNIKKHKMNSNNSFHQYNSIIINRILSNKSYSSHLNNKHLFSKHAHLNSKVSLLKNHSRSSSVLKQNNESWRNTSLLAQIENLAQCQKPSFLNKSKSVIVDSNAKINQCKSNRLNSASKKEIRSSHSTNLLQLKGSHVVSNSPNTNLKYA